MKIFPPYYLLIVCIFVGVPFFLHSQDQGFNYQAVASDDFGEPLANEEIDVRFLIKSGNPNGPNVYQEDHNNIRTNAFGLFSVVIGSKNPNQFNAIDWSADNYFLRVRIDNVIIGTDRFEAVPYSKVATHMDLEDLQNVTNLSPKEGQVLIWQGNNWEAQNLPENELRLRDLQDVANGGANQDQVLTWSGNRWEARNIPAVELDLEDLENVSNTAPNQDQVLMWKGNAWEPQTLPDAGGGSVWRTNNNTNEIYYNASYVGIGLANPAGKFHVLGREQDINLGTIRITTLGQGNNSLGVMRINGHEINTSAPILTFNRDNAGEIVLGEGGGNVGVGRFSFYGNDDELNTPRHTLTVRHRGGARVDGLAIQNQNNLKNSWHFHTANGNGDLILVHNEEIMGRFRANSGEYSVISDQRRKEHIQPLSASLEQIMKLQPVSYKMTNSLEMASSEIGLVAQQTEEVFPELVNYDELNDLYTLDYSRVGVLAIQAIQEQQQLLRTQQHLIDELQAKVRQLEHQLAELK